MSGSFAPNVFESQAVAAFAALTLFPALARSEGAHVPASPSPYLGRWALQFLQEDLNLTSIADILKDFKSRAGWE
jgi:hypothetical protein